MTKVTLAATANFDFSSRSRDELGRAFNWTKSECILKTYRWLLPAVPTAKGSTSDTFPGRRQRSAPLLAPPGRSGAGEPLVSATCHQCHLRYLYCLTASAPAGCRGKPGKRLLRYRSRLPWSKRCCRRTSLVPGSAAILGGRAGARPGRVTRRRLGPPKKALRSPLAVGPGAFFRNTTFPGRQAQPRLRPPLSPGLCRA